MPTPKTKEELQRFLGMVAYLSKFIPHLSEKTSLLRELLTKDRIWEFTSNHLDQFNYLKDAISPDISLKYFDQKRPTKVT